MPLIPWIEYESMMAGIADGTWRVIGWGAGVGFSHFNRNVALRHDYLVDSDPAKWGTRHQGFEVRSPQAIASEDPSNTIVIIYNFRDHGRAILSALERIGPYKAIMNFHPPALRNFAQHLGAGVDPSLRRKQPANSDSAILVQGPIEEGITEWAVRFYAGRYPNDWLIVSTWADSPADLVERIRPYCDLLLCNPVPAYPGLGNRNFQIVSTRAGLEEARRHGVSKVMKTRTNTLAAAADVLRRSAAFQTTFENSTCRAHGLGNRIMVTERITMRYVPYMISDILMFGDTEDMLRFWSAPQDTRKLDFSTWKTESFGSISRKREMNEIYTASHFLEAIGWPLVHTVEDHWSVLRDLFVVVDERWFGHFFPRYDITSLDDGRGRFHANSYVDFNFWQRLHARLDMPEDAAGIDLDGLNLVDIYDVGYHENPAPVNRR